MQLIIVATGTDRFSTDAQSRSAAQNYAQTPHSWTCTRRASGKYLVPCDMVDPGRLDKQIGTVSMSLFHGTQVTHMLNSQRGIGAS